MLKHESLNKYFLLKSLLFVCSFFAFQFNILGQISGQTNLQVLEITVLDAVMGKGISNSKITIRSKTSGFEEIGFSDEKGAFSVGLVPYQTYVIQVWHPNYFKIASSDLKIRASDMYPKKLVFDLQEIVLGMAIRWENILFLPNSSEMNPSSQESVDSLVNLLSENKNIRFEISCHTDSRGNDEYNMELSQKRAQTLVDYLIKRGIASQVLSPKGYGESRLINHCRNKVRCSSSQHQENRRVELIILSLQ